MLATPALFAARFKPRELRIVAVDHRRAARLDALEDFRLGVGDLLDRAEELQMHRLDRGDDRDMRAHQPGQRRNLAGVVHAHFEHGVTRALRAARQRQRHAPVIVVGRGRRMGLAAARQREPQRLLRAGLADRAGDADELRIAARARGAGRAARSASSTSGTISSGASFGIARGLVRRNHREARARLQRGRHEIMAVAHVGQREERLAGAERAACRSTVPSRRPAARPARRAPIAAAIASTVQSALRSCHLLERRLDRLVVAERQRPIADDLAGFMALAGDQQHIARLAATRPRCGSPRGGRRSRTRRAPPSGSRRGSSAGFSLRGLSSVTMTRSAVSRRDRAHQRALALVAVAAAAEHHDKLALHVGPQRLKRLVERVGLVRVVDEDRRAVALADEIEPALGALERCERREHRAGIAAGRDRQGPPRPARSRSGTRRPAAA